MMLRYLVFLIFTAALLGLSANPTVVHAQTDEQGTEPNQATQSDEKNESDQAASPDDSTQTDQSEDSNADQPADESDQPVGSEDAEPQDQDK
jgi:cytoskeletal protein RodZ